MTTIKDVVYKPDPARQKVYDRLYRLYRQLHDAFGGVSSQVDLKHIMKDLIVLKEEQNRPA